MDLEQRSIQKLEKNKIWFLSNNKIKTTRNIIKNETGKIHQIEQVPSSVVNI